jgi:hypothetical protein
VSLSILADWHRHDGELGARPELGSKSFAQAQERAPRACLDGPERPAQPGGDLGL